MYTLKPILTILCRMLLHKDDRFSIFFGDKQEQFIPANFRELPAYGLLTYQPFLDLQAALSLKRLVFSHQVHGINGITLHHEDHVEAMKTFTHDSDFIVTNLKYIGLGIATADCLPIIFYDRLHHVIAVAHAGWRGSVNNITTSVLTTMARDFNSNLNDIEIFFGPCAKVCCYAVDTPFIENLENYNGAHAALTIRNGSYFFDVPLLNQLQLEQQGIKRSAIHLGYNQCTLCNDNYCSFRREQKTVFRQMTVVSLL